MLSNLFLKHMENSICFVLLLTLLCFLTSSLWRGKQLKFGVTRLREGQGWWCLRQEVCPLSYFFPLPKQPYIVVNILIILCLCSAANAVTVRSTIRRLREQTEAWLDFFSEGSPSVFLVSQDLEINVLFRVSKNMVLNLGSRCKFDPLDHNPYFITWNIWFLYLSLF